MKFYGDVGYAINIKTEDGIYTEKYIKAAYFGDVLAEARRLSNPGEINDTISANVKISVIADEFALGNWGSIRYADYMGQKWKVTSVDVNVPRLILHLGELYRGTEEYVYEQN